MHKISPFIEYDIPNERFIPIRSIPGIIDVVENIYFISDYGRIMTIQNGSSKLMTLNYNKKNGYVYCHLLSKNESRIAYRVSRLVLLMFNYFEGCEYLEANHKNGLKDDNRLCNLEWLSHIENIHHAIANNLTNWNRSLTDEQVKEIRIALIVGLERRENLANRFNTTMNIINDIATNRIYQHVSIKDFEELLQRKANELDPDIIINIYNDILSGKSIDDISIKYNVEYFIIGCIKTKHPIFTSIIKNKYNELNIIQHKIDDNIVLSIYNELKQGKTEKQVAIEYNISLSTISYIRSCGGPYNFLKFKYGLSPLSRSNIPLSEEVIVDVFKKAGYMSVKDLATEIKISPKTIIDIKHCKGRFGFLVDKYGFVPYENQSYKNK